MQRERHCRFLACVGSSGIQRYYSSISLPCTSNTNLESRSLFISLLFALRVLPAAQLSQSRHPDKSLFDDLTTLDKLVSSGDFDTKRIRPLLDAVLECQPDEVVWDRVYDAAIESANNAVTDSGNNAVTESTPPCRPPTLCDQTPISRNTGSFANTTEHRKYVDGDLKEELGEMHVDMMVSSRHSLKSCQIWNRQQRRC